MNSNASQAYRRMIKTANELAFHPQLPLNSNLIRTIKERFEGFLQDTVFTSMKWFDPQYCEDSSDYGLVDINFITSHFKRRLEANWLKLSC